MAKADPELEMYRNLVPVPDHFEDGFGGKTIVGALFLGFIMLPASIYLSLFLGASLQGPAQWVTVILFAEMVKRSMKTLRQQEIMVLFYMTGLALSGGVGQPLLWNQYFVQSAAATGMGIAPEIPSWYAPSKEILQQEGRNFFTRAWMTPILLSAGTLLISRIDGFGLGYAMYRLTSHVEKLPFPMAPVGALGVSALAEDRSNTQRWRWRCFSLGGVIGLVWGIIYVGVPAVTGAMFTTGVKIVPIPWLDLTPSISKNDFLPATPLNLIFDLGLVLGGMVAPFWAIVGGLIAVISSLVMNPILHKHGYLPTWKEGMGIVDTGFSNTLDFYLSFGLGLMFAIFIVSVIPVIKPLFRMFPGVRTSSQPRESRFTLAGLKHVLFDRNRDRGDLSIFTALCIYVCSTTIYIVICLLMMPGDPVTGVGRFPWLFFLGFGFIYQPIISYINAKLAGMVGLSVSIPMVREASFILSGYTGAAIWFAPIPINDYGGAASSFRTMELTGTRLTSLIKTEILVFPILVLASLLFAQLIWRIAPIPSEAYPFTKEIWHQQALSQSLVVTSTLDGSSPFLEAIKGKIILWGLSAGLGLFGLLSFLNLPTFLIYGVVGGLGTAAPGAIIPTMIGALLSKFYFQKKFGAETFKKYSMILLAGFSAGVGLIGMASVAINLIVKSTTTLGY